MSVVTTPGLLDALADPRLLPAAHFAELVQTILPRCDDWAILGPELVYRNWLTPYQLRAVLDGSGNELIIGSYVLQEQIGSGGMGRIYRARNWKLDTPAAVKVIRDERARDTASVARFLREIRALGAISHPHLVHAFDADYDRGRLYCAMEYVPGTDLGHILQMRGALSVEQACRYTAQLAQALHYIAALGLVHRDVKPSNILVTADGGSVKLADLGLARIEDGAAGELTQVGMMIGTPDYTAPEQVRDSRTADIRSDLYSLGCTLYHMLTGRPPFAGLDSADKLYHQMNVDAVAIETIRPDLPPTVLTVVRTLLAKRPRDRYQDPREVVAVLRAYLNRAGDTVSDAAAPTAPGRPHSNPDWVLPRTDEIPVADLPMLSITDTQPIAWPARAELWIGRLSWVVAILVAGLAVGLLVGRN